MEKEQKIKGFGLVSLIIVIGIIAIMAGGGLYFRETQKQKSLFEVGLQKEKEAEALKKKIMEKNKQTFDEVMLKPISGAEKTPAPKVNTSNWKTYRNEKYGFEVKYPADWMEGFKDPQYSQSIFTLVSPSTRKAIENNIPGAGDVDIAVRILNISSFEKLDEELKPEAFFITNKRRSVLNGYDAYFMTIGGAGAKAHVYFHRNGKLITLVFDTGATGELRPLEQQILSTFKFTK